MVVVFGVSKGLGYSLVNSYLSLNVNVVGIGRRNSIVHPLYQFIEKDLSESNSWSDLLQVLIKTDEEVTLIYNAGDLGNVGLIESIDFKSDEVFQLNLFSWVEIVQAVLKELDSFRSVSFVAISSGAGRRGIAGWSQYGASKAALDNFMLTLKEEMLIANYSAKVYAISPGVMDTDMQKKIRGFSDLIFPTVSKYIDFNNTGLLADVDVVAAGIISFLSNPSTDNVVIGVQDF